MNNKLSNNSGEEFQLFSKRSSVKNRMKTLLFSISLFLSTILFGQNKHLSIGHNGNGVCFGNSSKYNGIRLNGWDKNVTNINGINISGFCNSRKTNGISIGIIANLDSISNGLKIGGLATYAEHHNGIALSGLIIGGSKFNGIGFAGISPSADTLNGIFVGLYGITPLSSYDSINIINGLAIGGLGVTSSKMNGLAVGFLRNAFDKQNGVSISCFNRAEELYGVQFGLLNYAGNNRRIFRRIPLINFNFKKKISI